MKFLALLCTGIMLCTGAASASTRIGFVGTVPASAIQAATGTTVPLGTALRDDSGLLALEDSIQLSVLTHLVVY